MTVEGKKMEEGRLRKIGEGKKGEERKVKD